MTDTSINHADEVWKVVDSYPRYQVSSHGRMIGYGKNNRKKKGFLTPQYDEKGYHRIRLYHSTGISTCKLHRLVALAFVSNPLEKPHINHIDGNKINNHYTNLEWVTRSENCKHRYHVLKVPMARRKNKA